MLPKEVTIVVDGGASPNPGHGAFGAVFLADGAEVLTISEYLGNSCSSNEAEFNAVLRSLRRATELGAEVVHFHIDSRFVEQTMAGNVRFPLNVKLSSIVDEINALRGVAAVDFMWVGRDAVSRAHELVQQAKAGRSFMAPRETGTSRLYADVVAAMGSGSYSGGMYTSNETGARVAILPYYHARPTVRPSVSRASWLKLSKADLLAWRPYGSNVVPLPAAVVGVQGAVDAYDGGVELLLARPRELRFGEPAGRLGYDGSPVMRLEGTLVPARIMEEHYEDDRRKNERRNSELRRAHDRATAGGAKIR